MVAIKSCHIMNFASNPLNPCFSLTTSKSVPPFALLKKSICQSTILCMSLQHFMNTLQFPLDIFHYFVHILLQDSPTEANIKNVKIKPLLILCDYIEIERAITR